LTAVGGLIVAGAPAAQPPKAVRIARSTRAASNTPLT
jgi:hypothetical protein